MSEKHNRVIEEEEMKEEEMKTLKDAANGKGLSVKYNPFCQYYIGTSQLVSTLVGTLGNQP